MCSLSILLGVLPVHSTQLVCFPLIVIFRAVMFTLFFFCKNNTGKQTDHPSRRAIAIIRLVRRIIVGITRQDGWSVTVYKCRNKTNYPRRLHLVTRSQLPASINYKNGLKSGRVTRHIDSLSHSPSRIYTRRTILLHGWSVWTDHPSLV